MSEELKAPRARQKTENITAEVSQIDWESRHVFVTYPNPDGGVRIGDFWSFDDCEIFPFIRLDKNGDKVFAGDKVLMMDKAGRGEFRCIAELGGYLKAREKDTLVEKWAAVWLDDRDFNGEIELIKEAEHE